MLGLLSSVLSGGLTGILGAGIQRFADFMNKKQDIKIMELKFAQEVKLKEVDASIMREEWAQRTKVAEVEGAAKVSVAEQEAFAKSFEMEPQRYSEKVKPGAVAGFMLVLIDFIRGLVRPGLTIYLCVLTTLIYFQARALLNDQALSPAEAMALTTTITETVLYLFTTVTLWYFGTRNSAKGPMAK